MNKSDEKKFNDSGLLDDELDLREIFNVLWDGKILIILITTILSLSSIAYSLMLPNYYTSESILVARDSKDANPVSQYSGLASLAGVKLPGSTDSSVFEVIELIKSREFVKHLLTFEDILPSLMAAESYNASSKELYFDSKIYNEETKLWIREPVGSKGIKPSYIEAHKVYKNEMLSISRDKATGLISMKIEHISPIFAKEFLELVIREANALNREIDIDSSSKALRYLTTELSQTSLIEIKRSINQLIEAQIETQMLASIHDEYSLILLEPPFVPEEKSKPSRSIIVIIASLMGGMFSVMIVLVRHYFFKKENLL